MNAENNIKRTKIGVIGGAGAYDKAMARIKLLGMEKHVDLILIDEEKCKDKGFHVNQVWIDECKEIPKILIEHTPKGCRFTNDIQKRFERRHSSKSKW